MLWKPLFAAWACGVAMHFLYRPLGRPRFLRALFPVSENAWEHVKMAFWPLCTAMIWVGVRSGTPWASVALACAAAAGHAVLMMLGLFYTYVAGLGAGHSLLPADIASFAAVMGCSYAVGLRVLGLDVSARWGIAAAALLAITVYLLHRWSFDPPDLPLFRQGGL